MSVLYIVLPLALVIALGALIAFILAARSGQFDDLETPAHRMLFDDDDAPPQDAEKARGGRRGAGE